MENVVIIGASCRAAAQCARRDGYAVTAIDMFGDRDLHEVAQQVIVNDLPKLDRSTLRLLEYDGVLLAGGTENHPEAIASLISNETADSIVAMRSPWNWKRWSESVGIEWPESCMHPSDRHQFLFDSKHRWLRKSIRSAGGMGVRAASQEDWSNESDDEFYMQKQYEGPTIGVTFLSSDHGTRVIGAVGAWSSDACWAPMEFMYRGSYGPIHLNHIVLQKLEQFGSMVCDESKIRGLWQADMLRVDGRLYLLEINPRWTASMELLDIMVGGGLVRLHFEAIGKYSDLSSNRTSVQPFVMKSGVVGKMIAYARQDFQPSQDTLDDWWSHRMNWADPMSSSASDNSAAGGQWLADIPSTLDLIAAGYPILTCLAREASFERLRATLSRMVGTMDNGQWTVDSGQMADPIFEI